jgi:predicted permease
VRGVLRNPLFAIAAVGSLAMGIGASTAIFSVVNAVLLEPLPYQDPGRLTIVWNEFPTAGLARLPVSGPELQMLRDEPGLFADVGGIWATSRAVMHDGQPETVSAGLVTPDFFSVLGVEPRLGRGFVRGESDAPVPAGVLVSDEFWRSHYPDATDPSDQVVRLEASDRPIVGVLPPGFELLFPPDGGIPERIDLFTPLPWNLYVLPPDQHYLRVVGRLADGVDLVSAQQHVTAVAVRVRETYTQLAATGDQFTVVPLHGDAVRNARPTLLALLGAVTLFLLLASANVAGLLLARTTTRGRELALRASLGASRRRIVQLLLAESSVLTGVGALLGLVLGTFAGDLLWSLRPEGVARIDVVPLDGRVLLFTLAASVVSGTLFGLAPLVALSSVRTATSLNERQGIGGPRQHRARGLIIVMEVAVGLTILVGATLLMRSLSRLEGADLGYQPAGLLSFKVSLAEQRFPTDGERATLAQELERRIAELPGVTSVGAGSHLPLKTWANWAEPAPPDGTPESERETFYLDHRAVTPGYLDVLQARLVSGRGFTVHDHAGSDPVAIVDRAYASRAFADSQAVGKRIQASQYVGGSFTPTPVTVVGVIDDIRDRSPSVPSSGQVYLPFAQSPRWELTYAVRSERDPSELAAALHDLVPAVHGDLAAAEVMVMDELVDAALASSRFVVLLAGLFSLLALVVAGIGIYSLVAYNTTQRIRDFGLRLALGATQRNIVRTVLGYGLKLSLVGVVVGIPLAIGVTQLLRSLLFDVQPHDPLTLTAVAAGLMVVAVLASIGPARRAISADPARIMR